MLTEDAVRYFGGRIKVAKALGLTKAAVYAWGERVPALSAALIEKLTHGELRFDPDEYENGRGISQQ